jgi:hypothetical protein
MEELMKPKVKKNLYWLIGLVLVIAFGAVMANQVRSNFGTVDVTYQKIKSPEGYTITARLYRPKYATAENKLPAVITINGWNNDKDTQGPASIELSRRGFVVLAVDPYGHGESTGPYPGISAVKAPEFALQGVEHAYDWLITQPFVDAAQVGITGHSMGAGLSRAVASARPNIQAVAMQCSCGAVKGFDYKTLHNFLCIYAQWEEMSSVNGGRGDNMYNNPVFYQGLGLTEPVVWDHNYGSFADDTAFQINLNRSTHPGTPPSHQMITSLVEWMRLSLKNGVYDQYWIPQGQHIYTYYDVFMGLALLAALGSTIPLANLLLNIPFFAPVATPMPKGKVAKPKEWWKMALINAFIAMITYPFLTGLGIAKGAIWLPTIFREGVPNGLAIWSIGNAIIFAVMFFFWYRKNSKENKVTMYDMGVSFDEKKTKLDWGIIGKSALLAVLLIVWLYVLVSISQTTLGIEFRVEYGTLKQFALPERFAQFFIWIIPNLALMLLNMGIFFFGQARQPEYESKAKTQVIWWLKNCIAALSFLALYLLFMYVPAWIFNTKVGLDLINFNTGVMTPLQLGGGSMYALSLFYIIPFIVVLIYFLTHFFRRTGKIYLGSFFVAMVIAWVWAVGHQFNIFPK